MTARGSRTPPRRRTASAAAIDAALDDVDAGSRPPHTAAAGMTRRPRARALVVGGFPSLASAARHDPVAGPWAPTGSLVIGRPSHTATLLPDGTVLAAGGVDALGSIPNAEVYTP